MISYDNNATTTTTIAMAIAMRIEQERDSRAAESGVEWRECWRGAWAERKRLLGYRSRCFSHTHTHTHTVRDTGEGLGLGLCLGIFPVRDSRSQHAIKCFCLINKKINFYETCLKQTTKIDWPDKMQLRFAKPAHTHTRTHPSTPHTHARVELIKEMCQSVWPVRFKFVAWVFCFFLPLSLSYFWQLLPTYLALCCLRRQATIAVVKYQLKY